MATHSHREDREADRRSPTVGLRIRPTDRGWHFPSYASTRSFLPEEERMVLLAAVLRGMEHLPQQIHERRRGREERSCTILVRIRGTGQRYGTVQPSQTDLSCLQQTAKAEQ